MIGVRSMAGHPEWIAACAAWWHPQWGAGMGYSPEGAIDAIAALTVPDGRQAALIGFADGEPAGSVFLVHSDLDTHAHLTPWLAGLFVLPRFRGRGLGEQLIDAVVEQARILGHGRLYLYTASSAYYRIRGWRAVEALVLHGVPHDVMTRATGATPATGRET